LSGSETKTVTGGHGEKRSGSEGWQGASVGAVSAKNALGFVLARKRRLDLATVRAVAERRPPERSGVEKRRAATAFVKLEGTGVGPRFGDFETFGDR